MKELFKAIKENNIEKVKSLILDRSADINAIDELGNTTLMRAAERGSTEVVKLLLDHGADINTKDEHGETALMRAVAGYGNTETVNLLLERGADINTINELGNTTLIRAAERGHTEVVNLLIDRGADINAINLQSQTALMMTAFHKHTEIVKLLHDHGADIHAIDKIGNTALGHAAEPPLLGDIDWHRIIEVITTLVELGIDITENDKIITIYALEKASWWTDSHTAVINNSLDDIQNVEDQSSPITPLDLAIMIGNLNAVKHIIERGSISTSSPTLFSSSNATNFDINDCLNKAIKAKRNDIAMFLLEKGADPQAKNQLGQNSLHIACSYGNKDIIQTLAEHNTKPRL
jgi:ankyrin repeat protein